MRGFMWTKIPPRQIRDTAWEDMDDESVKLNVNELEDLFGIEVRPPMTLIHEQL